MSTNIGLRNSTRTSQADLHRTRTNDVKERAIAGPGRPSFTPLPHERDNAAKIAWRNRLHHHDTFTLPADFLLLVSRPNGNPATLLAFLDNLGRRTRTQIDFNNKVRKAEIDSDELMSANEPHDQELLLWGSESETKAAKDALVQWISSTLGATSKVKTSKSMPNVYAQTRKTHRRYEYKLQALANQQAFRKDPDTGATFEVTGIYLWPLENAQPQDMLGHGFEALDPIRMFHYCHIVFDCQSNTFTILANSNDRVRKAIESIENAVLEFKASNSIPLETYVIYPPDTVSARRFVGISDSSLRGMSEKHRILHLDGGELTPEESSLWEHNRLDVMRHNQLKMQSAMVQTLSRVCLHRGKVQMRVQIGSFTVKKLGWETPDTSYLPLQQFFVESSRNAPEGNLDQLPATLDSAKTVIRKVLKADQLLMPHSGQTFRLEDTLPIVTAIFTFKSHGKGQLTYETGEGTVNRHSLDNDVSKGYWSAAKSLPLQMYSIGLNGGITWRLQVSTHDLLEPYLDSALENFGRGISYSSTASLWDLSGAAKPMFTFLHSPLLESFTQRSSFRFRIRRNSSYVLELSIFDSFRAHDRKHVGTRWAVTVYHQGWDEILVRNSALRRGSKATWKPDLEQFFPCANIAASKNEHPGFTELLEILQSVVELVDNTNNFIHKPTKVDTRLGTQA